METMRNISYFCALSLMAALPLTGCGQEEQVQLDVISYNIRMGVADDGENSWEIYLNGGRTPTGIDCLEWVKKAVELGAGEILLTSMDADGTKNGYDIPLTRAVSEAVNVPVIASGGAGRNAGCCFSIFLFSLLEICLSSV